MGVCVCVAVQEALSRDDGGEFGEEDFLTCTFRSPILWPSFLPFTLVHPRPCVLSAHLLFFWPSGGHQGPVFKRNPAVSASAESPSHFTRRRVAAGPADPACPAAPAGVGREQAGRRGPLNCR